MHLKVEPIGLVTLSSRFTLHASRFTLHASRCVLVACVLTLMASTGAAGQTREQIEMLRQNPQLLRQQIQRSGLTEDQIRQRLRTAGYSPALLDQFLQRDADVTRVAVSDEMLMALSALGVPFVDAEGLEDVGVAVGMQPGVMVPADTGLQVFGLNVFRRPTTQFQPLLTGPVPPTYRLGAGDVLVLVLTGDVELVHELSVTREGFIVIPQVGQLFVANLTMQDLTALLRRRLGQSYSGIRTGTTRFDVTVARLRTNQIYVVGEVLQPGAYQLSSVATVLNALYASGGLTKRANFREVVVQRQGDTVAALDLYDYLLRGDTRNDVVLEQGDVVFVPVRGLRASVTGAVVRPAIYELGGGETLADLIAMAGGLRADAESRRLAVHRILPPSDRGPVPGARAVIDVPLGGGRREEGAGRWARGAGVAIPVLALEDGDSVVVDSILPFYQSLYVTVGGMVNKPGSYAWAEGMTLRDLVLLARGPRVGADLREAEIARLPEDRRTGTLVNTLRVPLDSTYLFERDSLGRYRGAEGLPFPAAGSAPEVALEPYDQVTIFRQPEFELQRTVWITGEVRFPGPYALTHKSERVSDLFQRAGGTLSTAYVEGARFFRVLGTDTSRVNVDVRAALASPETADDITLQPGDSVFIPEYIPTVLVSGAVVNPASVLFKEGEGLEYYIGNAGGYARNADKGRVSVQYANGSAAVRRKHLFFATSPTPGPGSVVTVPEVPQEDKVDVTSLLGTLAQVLTSAVAIIVIAVR